jgi:hypothetical protein
MAAGKSFNPSESGYVEVKDRIKEFMERYPDGSLQSEIVEMTDSIVVMRGYAYRTPDDERPGIGHSQMPIPGKTPYTKDSEVENAETSAWGRAIAALGFAVHNSIASAEEVAMKAGPLPSASAPASSGKASTAKIGRFIREARKVLGTNEEVKAFVEEHAHVSSSADLTDEAIDALHVALVEAKMDQMDKEADDE